MSFLNTASNNSLYVILNGYNLELQVLSCTEIIKQEISTHTGFNLLKLCVISYRLSQERFTASSSGHPHSMIKY